MSVYICFYLIGNQTSNSPFNVNNLLIMSVFSHGNPMRISSCQCQWLMDSRFWHVLPFHRFPTLSSRTSYKWHSCFNIESKGMTSTKKDEASNSLKRNSHTKSDSCQSHLITQPIQCEPVSHSHSASSVDPTQGNAPTHLDGTPRMKIFRNWNGFLMNHVPFRRSLFWPYSKQKELSALNHLLESLDFQHAHNWAN